MTKIMLVEDDNNLREIYGARLMAEGYQIVSAADGEEALALAVKEKPELIVADVMMPKISGFDMLDILRTTPETKNTKVIIMTALSQPEDRARGEALGADKYLVKSQVTLEDVVAAVHEILGDGGGGASAPTVNETMPSAGPGAPGPATAADAPATPPPTGPPAPDEQPPKVEGASDAPEPASRKKRVIEPINDLSHEREDFLKMVAEEEARDKQSTPGASVGPTADPDEQQAKMAESMAEEKKQMEEDVKNMVNDGTIDAEAATPPVRTGDAGQDGGGQNQSPAGDGDTQAPTPPAETGTPPEPRQPLTPNPAAPVPPAEVATPAAPEAAPSAAPEEADVPQPGTSVEPEGGESPPATDAPAPAGKPDVPQPPAESDEAGGQPPANPNDIAL